MENTLTLFENQTEPKWFVVIDTRLLGPVSSKEVALWVTGNEISLASYIWRDGQNSWKRVYDVKDFHPLLPKEPNPAFMAQARSKLIEIAEQKVPHVPPPPEQEQRRWFLYMNNAQYGPFSESEIYLMVEAGRVNHHTYLWRKGMKDWELAGAVKELHLKLGAQKPETEKSDKRTAPRRPFEAKILLTDGQEVGWALCRDISIGGMQVLMDKSPGVVGTTLKLNVTTESDIPSFACEGEIVRILEDGRGFSFRFLSLPAKARTAIEKYIA